MILNDIEILNRVRPNDPPIFFRPMIDPFEAQQVKEDPALGKVISYGLSSFGYDVRLGTQFKIFNGRFVVDPKNFDARGFDTVNTGEPVTIAANSFVLGQSFEYIRMPRDTIAICLGKSTYARCGIVVNVTPLEPEWEGHITIEISNTTPNAAIVYPLEGICQLLFLTHQAGPMVSYADRNGKYMGQTGVTGPMV